MKLLDFLGGGIIDSIGKVADDLITSDEERLEKENEIKKSTLVYNLEMARVNADITKNEQNNTTNRWTSDNQGNFLTKSVRPLTLIYMIVILTIMAFFDGNVGEFKINTAYIDLFQMLAITVFGAFFGMKSLERIKARVRD